MEPTYPIPFLSPAARFTESGAKKVVRFFRLLLVFLVCGSAAAIVASIPVIRVLLPTATFAYCCVAHVIIRQAQTAIFFIKQEKWNNEFPMTREIDLAALRAELEQAVGVLAPVEFTEEGGFDGEAHVDPNIHDPHATVRREYEALEREYAQAMARQSRPSQGNDVPR